MSEKAEVVVIGGGIMGASVAFALTKLGVRDVLLVERETLAAGASGKTGALLRQHYTNVPEATLAHLSLQTYRHWAEEIGGDCGFAETGSIVTVATSGEDAVNVERMRRVVAMQNQVGIKSEVITGDQLVELQPFATADDIAVAAYERESGYVDSLAATRGMAEAAIRGGARFAEGRTVTGILTDGDRVRGVETDAGSVEAGAVVTAAGAWSVPLLAGIGVEVPVEAQRVQVVILARPLAMPAVGTMTYVDTAAGFFCRNWGPNRTLAGVGGGEFHDIVDPFNWDERPNQGFGDIVKRYISRRMPAMAEATTLYGHAGIYDMTPDTHPILSTVDGLDGLYLMLGFSGAGFKKGPAIGQCMAELIVHGKATTVDLTPFRLARFDDDSWQEAWSPDEYSFSTDFGHKF
ncbi:MAG TPA: FAD-dependent oxidoreductase [Thermomicrobiales bacterium]|nr:FAD-dependent oxidoreductase [Thermomicrobiales bacterium]